MKCFNGDPETRRRILQRAHEAGIRASRGEDRKAIFWSRRSWCGAPYVCNKPNCDHSFYAAEIGVPIAIAYAEHSLFNELSNRSAGRWPTRFLNALSLRVDGVLLNEVWRDMALFVLADKKYGLLNVARTPEQTDAIVRIVELFESRSTNGEEWEKAGRIARHVYSAGPNSNSRLDAEPALVHAGAMACYSAAHFAYAFANPRYSAEALSWAPWAHRYRKYGELMRGVKKGEVPADEHGMVSVAASLWEFGIWMRNADRCESEGELVRIAMYEVYADQFIRLIKRCVRDNSPGAGAAVYSLLASLRSRVRGWTSRFGRKWNVKAVG